MNRRPLLAIISEMTNDHHFCRFDFGELDNLIYTAANLVAFVPHREYHRKYANITWFFYGRLDRFGREDYNTMAYAYLQKTANEWIKG